MAKILLIDVDSKIPNLAIMKLSTHHKLQGDSVEIKRLNYSGYPDKKKETIISAKNYDKTYVSTIFTINNGLVKINDCNEVYFGGTGYDIYSTLPQEIDDLREDYSLYPDNIISYGFITRGCIRKCSFCFVPRKEGDLRFYRTVDQIKQHKLVEFLDNNFLAYDKSKEVLEELISKRIKCNFNQGLDIRLITDENAKLLSQLNYQNEYIFAFDNIKSKSIIESKFNIVKKYISKPWKVKMFVLVGWDSSLADDLERIEWCRENEILPYLMRHEKCWSSDNRNFYIDIASYCNQPALFKKLTFEEYMKKRTTNINRQNESIELYKTNLNFS